MKQVFAVEDDESLCRLYQLWLQPYGYAVSVYGCAETFLEAWPEVSAPHVLLIDRGLPGLSGLELIQRLHQDGALDDVPVIFCSGYDYKDDIAEALYAGADDYIVKPVEKTLFLARLAAVTRRYKQSLTFELPTLLEHNSLLVAGEKQVQLSQRESQAYRLLASAEGSIVSRAMLYEQLIREEFGAEAATMDPKASIDLVISRLRKKLKKLYPERDLIVTHYGKGYSLLKPE
ncbi:MAG: response regulator transcription factor [Saccharospirillum sp.]